MHIDILLCTIITFVAFITVTLWEISKIIDRFEKSCNEMEKENFTESLQNKDGNLYKNESYL